MSDQQATIIDGNAKEAPGKQLFRSTTNRSIAGVCGGLGEYFGIDVSLIRMLWALSALFSFGASLLVYVVLAVLIPEEDAEYAARKRVAPNEWWDRARENSGLFWGVVLMFAGVLLLLDNLHVLPVRLGVLWNMFWAVFWPLLLIGLGVLLLLSLNGRGPDWRKVRGMGRRLPLRRSREDRVFAGVCGGLGEYLHVDPVFVRLAWALFTVFTLGTLGGILYLVAALVIPSE